jgi:ATP-binding cassette subfamily B protein
MKYNLNQLAEQGEKKSTLAALKSLLELIAHERKNLLIALVFILMNTSLNLTGPYLIGYTIDTYVQHKLYSGVLLFSSILLGMYLVAFFTSYFQTKMMGGVGQRLLFTLRNAIFSKLQNLPVAFFNSNKAGDLISRVNNDTDKLNSFFSQSLMQFVSSIAIMVGAGVVLLVINFKMGVAALLPGLVILVFTQIISPWVKKKNAVSMTNVGAMSAEIQESLNNFKVIVAFDRRDYFRKRFHEANQKNYSTAIMAGIANNSLLPVYSLFSSLAQLMVLAYGIYTIPLKDIGVLIAYLSYVTLFYNPLRQLASLWTSFQVAMAGWDRIAVILGLDTDLVTVEEQTIAEPSSALVEFRNVHFCYEGGKEILHNISLELEKGKTYAFVGPTGGGKTTTASLIARLYDPTTGTVFLDGKDIRTYSADERSRKIGFILQEPFLFTGTVRENILYSNEQY